MKVVMIIMIVMMVVIPLRGEDSVHDANLNSPRRVYAPGVKATYICTDITLNVVGMQWLINGTQLENLNLSNVNAMFSNGVGRLEIFHIPLEYNDTTIQCIANFGNRNEPSNILTLLVQGPLPAVQLLSVSTVQGNIYLTWEAPFSLDMPSYCVEVANSISLIRCGISTTEYSFPIGRVCSNNITYTFAVTPVNIAGNGESSREEFTVMTTPVPKAKTIERRMMSGANEVSIISMSAPVCDGVLVFKDQNTEEMITMRNSELSISGNIISFTNERLRKNRLYTVTINATNINGPAISSTKLSTHDIKNVTVYNTSHIIITTEYFKHSTAKGVFYIIIRSSTPSYLSLDRDASINYTLPDDLTPGMYRVFAYDIESDGRLHNEVGYPAGRSNFYFNGHNQDAGSNEHLQPTNSIFVNDIECNVDYTGGVILTLCSYSGSNATGFQMIVLKDAKAGVILTNTTTEHLSPGPVTVQVNASGTYHVSIFPIMGEKGIVDTTATYLQSVNVLPITSTVPTVKPAIVAVIVVTGIIVILVMIFMTAIIVYLYFKLHISHIIQINSGTSSTTDLCTYK